MKNPKYQHKLITDVIDSVSITAVINNIKPFVIKSN